MNIWTRCCPVCDRRLEKTRPYQFFNCGNCGWQEKTNDMIEKERA